MDSPLVVILAAVVGIVLGALVGLFVARRLEVVSRERERLAGQDQASRILDRARGEAENLRRAAEPEGKSEVIRLREVWEADESRRREEVEGLERRLLERTESLDRKFDRLNERETSQEERARQLEREARELDERVRELGRSEDQARAKLEALAGMSAQEAPQDAGRRSPGGSPGGSGQHGARAQG